MRQDELAALIAEYGRLLRWFRRLAVEADAVDRRLTEIERQLPDSYIQLDDPQGGSIAAG